MTHEQGCMGKRKQLTQLYKVGEVVRGHFLVEFMLEFEKLGNEVGVVYEKVEATKNTYLFVWYGWKEEYTLTDS